MSGGGDLDEGFFFLHNGHIASSSQEGVKISKRIDLILDPYSPNPGTEGVK